MRVFFVLPVLALAVAGAACKPSPAPTPGSSGSTAAASAAPPSAASAPAASPDDARRGTFTGTIAEALDAGDYTYARLQGSGQDVWIAATRFDAAKGRTVTVPLDMPMKDFESKTLSRTFPLLYFVSEIALDGKPLETARSSAAPRMMSGHGAGEASRAPAQVARLSPPPGGFSIADVIAKRDALSGKPVTVQGTVVKFNGGIMDRNWLHLQDGSGSVAAGTHDLTVTTSDAAQVGDVVTVTGIVGTGKDFGAGYAYDVIVEQGAITRK